MWKNAPVCLSVCLSVGRDGYVPTGRSHPEAPAVSHRRRTEPNGRRYSMNRWLVTPHLQAPADECR